jgi:hypothetical protein
VVVSAGAAVVAAAVVVVAAWPQADRAKASRTTTETRINAVFFMFVLLFIECGG